MNLTPLRGALDALDTANADLASKESVLSSSLTTQGLGPLRAGLGAGVPGLRDRRGREQRGCR